MEKDHQPLTDREWAVLQLVAEGLSNQEIAERLTLGLTTVKWFLRQIFNKLGANRRTEAVRIAQALGLVKRGASEVERPPGLPAPVTPLIGRAWEVAEVRRLLNDPDSRLVTILGPGGMGKTHLAQAIAWQQAHHTPGQVCFVALDSVGTPAGVIPAIAAALGFQFYGQLDPDQQLLAGLRSRQLFLVLDNFEHLLGAGRFVGDMLAAAPGLKILTTSRERLNLRAETVFSLGGLAYPPEPLPVQNYAAFQLFVQAARRAQPGFEPTDDDVNHINRICRLVEGMPLGLALAAAWIDMLTPGQIADEIAHSLTLLQTTLQDMPERHRSLRAVCEQSWQLLADEARAAFKRLSVFRGGFDRAAAAQVAGTTLFMLSTLVDKSLVVRVGSDRFRVHELLRQFAEEKLRMEAGDYPQTLSWHCQHYASRMQDYELQLKAQLASLPGSLINIQKDFDNILAGWSHALDAPLGAEIGQYAYSLGVFLAFRGLSFVGEQTFAQALQRLEAQSGPVSAFARVRVVLLYSWFLCDRAQFEKASQLLESALELAPVVSSPPADISFLWVLLGWALYLNGQPQAGRERLEQALAMCQAADFQFGVWMSHGLLGEIAYGEGNSALAIQYHQQALADCERHRYLVGMTYNLACLGCTCGALGDTPRAYHYLRRSLSLNREILASYAVFLTLIGIAALYEQRGQPEAALELLAIALHHPQCSSSAAAYRAWFLLAHFQARLPAEQVEAVMAKSQQGRLSSRYLDAGFTVTPELIDQLLQLLDQVADS